MVALGIVVSFLVVLLNMHTMVLGAQRAKSEFSKRWVFSRLDIVRMLLGETLILTLMGTGLGNSAYFPDAGDLETDESRLNAPDFPDVDFFRRPQLALVGAANGSGVPRAARPPATTPSSLSLTNKPRRPDGLRACLFGCFLDKLG